MGPELILKKRYTKGVDVFATGIILHMLLTGGEHPLYDSRDFQVDKYKKQLLALQSFDFPAHLSPLARNIFLRLTKFNITMRYNASEALRHPWITRLNKTLIPMTLQDKIENMEIERNFRSKIGLMIFLSNVSQAQCHFGNSEFQEYKSLLSRATRKIERWHHKFDSNQKQKEFFARDEEFIELDESPTKFDDSTSEEDGSSKQESESHKAQDGGSPLGQQSVQNTSPLSDPMSTIVTKHQEQKTRKTSLQTRANGEFKLRLEHANIRKASKKADDDQIIKF